MKNKILAIFASLFFITGQAKSFIHCSEIDKQSSVKNSDMEATELMQLVGLPFIRDPSLHVHNSNSKGEAVGIAHFKNPNPEIGTQETIAWHWHPQNGFQVITSASELLCTYGKDWKIPFQFSKLVINESGIVAGSFLIDKVNDVRGTFNQYPWFWWSVDQGIHLSTSPDTYQIVCDINNHGSCMRYDQKLCMR